VDYLWTPWRYQYVTGAETPSSGECVFCAAARGDNDRESLVVHRAQHNFVILNRFPYTNGHVMVVPRTHTDRVESLADDAFAALNALLRETISALRSSYAPAGINVGMNMGEAAGAGIAEHLHWHALPRWKGDANFMPVIADTKVISEALDDTWDRLASILRTPDDDAP